MINYHFNPNNNNDDIIINQNTIISKDITKYLKNFQMCAVKFLYKNFEAHKACILNDESGLGKTVSVAIFLNAILSNCVEKRKCLIICKNEERITNWKFHFDVLTNLSFKVVCNENEIDDHVVYLTKWDSLRSSASLANYNFDCIIVDNRENLMANKICLAYLLRNYENKISLIISNQDVTIDLKELHSMLRLCGRLDTKYRDFKVFENKFELPLVRGCANDNQKMLESYFLRREKILNYCKEFCLRRFRHQFESFLPLVSPNIYRLNVKKWEDSPSISKIKPIHLNICCDKQNVADCDFDTEELHKSFLNKNRPRFASNSCDTSNLFYIRNEEDELNNEVCRITTTIPDNAVEHSTEIMSPLIFIPDDSRDLYEPNSTYDSISTIGKERIKIIHPTAIHITNTSESYNENYINNKNMSKISNLEEDHEIINVHDSIIDKKKKCVKSEYKELNISRISTRAQDRITRSQAKKKKNLIFSIEDTIKNRERVGKICSRKKRNVKQKEISKPLNTQTKFEQNAKTNDLILKDNMPNSNESITISILDQSCEPICSNSASSNISILRKTALKISEHQAPKQTGIGLLDIQQSDDMVVIESTPEIINLSSSTDLSDHINKPKNLKSFTKRSKYSNILKSSAIMSPDIFGSAIDESLNIPCSQNSKVNQNNLKKGQNSDADLINAKQNTVSTARILRTNSQIDNARSKKNLINYEIIDSTENRNFQQSNKITNYLQKNLIQNLDEITSSSSQSIDSSPFVIHAKSQQKRKVDIEKGRSNISRHSRSSSSTTSPTKTPTALTKWLLKSNDRSGKLPIQKKIIKEKNEEDVIETFKMTRSSSLRKRRRLNIVDVMQKS